MIGKIKARDLKQTPFSNPTQVFTNKINEVIDELNELAAYAAGVDQRLYLHTTKESAKREENQRDWTGSYVLAVNDIQRQAIADYKKRLVEKLEKVSDIEDDYRGVGLDYAIKLVEETF